MFDLIEPAHLYCQSPSGGRIEYTSALQKIDFATALAWMFCHRTDGGKWQAKQALRIRMHVPLLYGDVKPEVRTEWYYQIAQVMQLITYGAMAGWNVNVNPSPQDDYDDITVDEHLPGKYRGKIDEFRRCLGLDERNIREMTKVDVLRFALAAYESGGRKRTQDIVSTQAGNALRIQVSNELLGSCLEDLQGEGWLEFANLGPPPAGPPYCMVPAKVPAAEDAIQRLDNKLDSRLMKIAKRNEWTSESNTTTASTAEPAGAGGSVERVFIIHGHDKESLPELKNLLENRLGLSAVIMKEEPGKGRTIIEKYEAETASCQAAMAILTPDDVVVDTDAGRGQPRQNVILELGWFLSRWHRSRVLLIVKEGTELPSDLQGIEQIRFGESIDEAFPALKREVDAWRKP